MIEPINFLGAVRKRWRLIVLLAVVGAVIALLVPSSSTKHPKTVLKWETVATVGAPASSGLISNAVSNAQILFYANTFPVKLAAVSDAGLAGNPFVYASGMFGTSAAGVGKGPYPTAPPTATATGKAATGGLVALFAQAPTPQLAAALTNAYAKELGNTLEQVATANAAANATSGNKKSSASTSDGSQPASTTTGYQVVFPGTPELARRVNLAPVNTLNSKKVRLLLGLVVGGLLALLVILVRELLDKSIRRPGRAEVHCKFPVIAEIPETYPPDPALVDVVDRPTSPAAEAYRKLRMSILFESMAAGTPTSSGTDPFADLFPMAGQQVEPYKVPEPGSRNVLLVVSTDDEPSRPKVVANLAATYAEAAEQVIVVSSGDLDVGTAYPADGVLSGPLTADDIRGRLSPAGPDNVSMLSLRHFMRNSGQLVARSKEVFDAARAVADVVIVEAPAFLRFHHAEAMVHSVDAVVVVVDSGVTESPDAQDMGDILRRLGAPVLGVVFTGVVLPRSKRRVLEAGVLASARSQAALDAGATEADDALDGPEPVADTAPELHPS